VHVHDSDPPYWWRVGQCLSWPKKDLELELMTGIAPFHNEFTGIILGAAIEDCPSGGHGRRGGDAHCVTVAGPLFDPYA